MGIINGNNNQVTITVNDLVPPENFATIDTDSQVGNAISKVQFNEKFQDKSDDLDEKIAEIKAQVETDFQGTLKPTDAAPTVDGSYKPEIYSADPGTNYPNAGNLKAKEGYETMFFKKGTVWTKSEVKIPGSTAKTTYDKTDNVSPATMKAAADRFDPALTVLDSLVNATKRVETVITMPYSGEVDGKFKNTSFVDVTDSSAATGQIPIADLQGVDYLRIEGDMTSMGAGMMYLGMRTAAGTNVSIKSGVSTSPFEIAVDHTAQYYVYSRFKNGNNPTKFKKVSIVPDIKTDVVAASIGSLNSVLKSYINPTQIVWEEITMPYSGEVDGKFRYCGYTYDSEPNWATGEILASELAGYKYFKMTGDFRAGGTGMLYLWRYSSTTPYRELCGNQEFSEYIMDIEAAGRIGIGYSRKKGVHKFYKGKVVSIPITEDSVNIAIQNASASAKHRMVDAFVEFNVKASNTAAQNTEGLNQAILAAYSRRVPIYLPSGVIKVNEITYMPGVIMIGAGMENTTLECAAGTNVIGLLDPGNNQAFWEGNGIYNLTIDGANIADVGINFRHAFGPTLCLVRVRRCKKYSVDYEGVLSPRFDRCKFQEYVTDNVRIRATDVSSAGYMQANIVEFQSCWFVVGPGKSVILDRASNIYFRQCNFERIGTSGNINTGGIFGSNISPGNEGIDIVMSGCWSETLMGPLLTLVNCKGTSVIDSCMIGNPGNTSTTQIINNGCRLLITGGTQIRFSTTGVLTQNSGQTYVDGFTSINSHIEQTGGLYKQATYS